MTLSKPKADLAPLFAPRGVAFVGVSEDQARYGGRMLRYCLDGGFTGGIYPVNPKYERVFDLCCYPDVTAIEGTPDVVIALVGAERLPALYEASTGRAKIIIVVGAIVPGDSPDKEKRLAWFRERIARGGPRLVGPMCMGAVAPYAKLSMSGSSTLPLGLPKPGPVGFITQSGGILSGVIDRARLSGAGFSAMVSSGGEFDLDTSDYLEFMIGDDATRAIAIYAEGLDDYPRFFALAERAREAGKPIVLMKPGFTEAGQGAALSHTGRIAGDRAVQTSAFRRHGIVLASDIDDLHATAGLLAGRRVDPDKGLGAATLSGGYAVALGDAFSDAGLRMATLAEATKETLRREVAQPKPANPADIGARPTTGHELVDLATGLQALHDDPNVGAVYYGEMGFLGMHKSPEPLAGFAQRATKPVVLCWQGGPYVASILDALRKAGLIVFDTPATAIRALKALYDYGRISRERAPATPRPRHAPARLARLQASLLSEADSFALLEDYGIPVARYALTRTADEAAASAEDIGFPVALKGIVEGVAHKTERGLVRLGLRDSAALNAAARAMAERAPQLSGFLVQAMAPAGFELLAGVTSDVHVGPAVVLGWGGVYAEAMGPPIVEVAPLDRRIADGMIARLDPKGLLTGYRTGRAMDRAGLAELLVALSCLAYEQRARLREIDLNPVIVGERSAVAVDALVRLG